METNQTPYLLLMKEHRLIERMISAIKEEVRLLKLKKDANPVFIDLVVDFLRTYADRCHHGKEEEILFRALEKKKLSPEHKKMMARLIEEHGFARKLTGTMAEANMRYIKGDKQAIDIIVECMKHLVDMYPQHIQREDHEFFIPVMEYFSEDEKAEMIKKEHDFDRFVLRQKYEIQVAEIEKLIKK
jgi:hemerythrin-like domain-containing protein